MTALSAEQVRELLGLAPHPEGGFFRETFRAVSAVTRSGHLERAASTAIYFLLQGGDFSAFHTVQSDEIWHFYAGSAVELHTIDLTGRHAAHRLGLDLASGERPQFVVPAHLLQAARVTGAGYALCGCTVAPGFDFADFHMPTRVELIKRYPHLAAPITELTR